MTRMARVDEKVMFEIFREENGALKAEDRALAARYSELQGNSMVSFEGEELTAAAKKLASRIEEGDLYVGGIESDDVEGRVVIGEGRHRVPHDVDPR